MTALGSFILIISFCIMVAGLGIAITGYLLATPARQRSLHGLRSLRLGMLLAVAGSIFPLLDTHYDDGFSVPFMLQLAGIVTALVIGLRTNYQIQLIEDAPSDKD